MPLVHDLRAAARSLRRSGAIPIVIVLMLAVAIGAVTAIFSIADAVLLRPLPIADPDRVVVLWGRDEARSQSIVEVSLRDLAAWRAGPNSLSRIELFGSVNWGELQIASPGEPFGASMNAVSAGFFDVLGAPPLLGRTFRPEDDLPNAPGRVILSGDLWRRRFASDPKVVGTVLTVGEGRDAKPWEVIGVMPADFRVPSGADVWIPLGPALAAAAVKYGNADDVRAMYAVARLQPGATVQHAMTELSTIARRAEIENGSRDSTMVVVATPILTHLVGPARPALFAIGGAAAMLLMIGCMNAAGLLLVYGAARRREVAVRFALGARRAQIVRQLLCESLLLSLIASGAGIALAYASFGAIVGLAPIEVPRLDQASIDARAMLAAVAIALVTSVIVGVLPAWHHTSLHLLPELQERAGAGTAVAASPRVRKALVAAQIAAALVLLTGAGLFTRSFVALLRLDLGFDPTHVLTFRVTGPQGAAAASAQGWSLVDAIADRATRVPGGIAAGAISERPFAHGPIGMDAGVLLEGQRLSAESSARNPIVNWEVATPGYFAAMDIRLLRGRLIAHTDTAKSPAVVIVSEALARRLWPGQDPIGRRLLTYGAPGDASRPGWQTVVGVVESARYREIETPRFDLYLPYRQAPDPVQYFVLRLAGDPAAAVPALRTVMSELEPRLRVDAIATMTDIVGRVRAPWRFSAVVVSIFSMMAVTFAAVGVAALVAYAVRQRTREIGVRMALGATRRHVVTLLIKEGAWMVASGVAAGAGAAWMLRRSVARLLFSVSPDDAATFTIVIVVLSSIALLAIYVPARRAAHVDPAIALRGE